MLTNDIIDEIRAQLDESNKEDVSDARILQALNRGQQKLVRLATRKYNPMFMRETRLQASDFTGREAALPEQSFAYTVNIVEVIYSGRAYKVAPAQLSQMSLWDNETTSDIPRFYAIRGNKLLLFPALSGAATVRVRYQIRPPKLAKSEGRITNISGVASGILYVDALGDNVTTSVNNLKCFINIIDGTTGLVKSTHQIAALNRDEGRITVKSASLNRTTVFGQQVSTTIPTSVELDDYITIADSTCIPTLVQDYTDYLIAFATLEVKRSMGEDTQAEYAALKELETDVQLMWSGRPANLRVENKSKHWGRRIPLINIYNS